MNKIILYTWVFVLTMTSCNSENKKSRGTSSINHMTLTEFTEKFEGVWLPELYVNEIRKSKSAYLSRNSIPEISELTIHRRNLKNDTLFVGSSLNNHEGFGFTIWDSGQQENSSFSNNIFDWSKEKKYQFTYDLTKKSISIIRKNMEGKIDNQIDYIKVLEPEYVSNFGGVGYEIISREVTLNGKYQILDSLKKDLGVINFEPKSGKIQNFEFSHYSITTDFIGPQYPSDYILLRLEQNKRKNQKYLSLINSNDSIILYDNKEIMTDSTYEIGLNEINYYLTKINY